MVKIRRVSSKNWRRKSASGLAEFSQFLKENKKWWLLPIVPTILLLGALVLLSGTAAEPFIYTLF